MPPRLPISSTSVVVRLCRAHLRRIYRNENVQARFEAGALKTHWYEPSARDRQTEPFEAFYNQEFVLLDEGGGLIVKCHWFLGSDMHTPVASGLPDPKEMCVGSFHYRLVRNPATPCAHCAAGIPKA